MDDIIVEFRPLQSCFIGPYLETIGTGMAGIVAYHEILLRRGAVFLVKQGVTVLPVVHCVKI
jgi:hypothetical protein